MCINRIMYIWQNLIWSHTHTHTHTHVHIHLRTYTPRSTTEVSGGCDNVELEQAVEFEVSVTLNSCDNFQNSSALRWVHTQYYIHVCTCTHVFTHCTLYMYSVHVCFKLILLYRSTACVDHSVASTPGHPLGEGRPGIECLHMCKLNLVIIYSP